MRSGTPSDSWPTEARQLSLAAYGRGAALAAERGIIIADTKFELGMIYGRLSLCDEVLTPDFVAVLAGRRVEARQHAGVVRQAAAARSPRDARLGQDAAAP